MSSAIYIDRIRKESVSHNPYYEFFKDSVGKGDKLYYSGLGDIYSTVPDMQSGYGLLTRASLLNNSRVQLGNGIGSWISRLFQFAKPLLKRGAKEVLNFGTNLASDVLEGSNPKASFKKHLKNKVNDILPEGIANEVNKRIGSGRRKLSKKKAGVRHTRKNKKSKYPVLGLIS
jgi:hypothetical protein